MTDVQDKPREATELAQFKLRIREDLRARVESAAGANATSMNSEIAARLDRSFDEDFWFGSGKTRALLGEIAGQIARAEAVTGKSWHEDAPTYFAARQLIEDALKRARPRPENYDEANRLNADRIQLEERRDQLAPLLMKCGAIAPNQNALAMFAGGNEPGTFYELPEENWHVPDTDTPLDNDLTDELRERVFKLMAGQGRIAEISAELERLMEPWRIAQTSGKALYRHLTQPSDLEPMEAS